MKDDRHELMYLDLDLLVPNGWNPQHEDEATFNRLVEEVKADSTGFIDPLQVVPLEDGTYRILGGEHRWLAARAADLDEVPCLVLQGAKWKDEDLQKFTTVRLNAIKGKLDSAKFLKLYDEMALKYGADAMQGLMGFASQKEFQKLLNGISRGMKKALSPEMQEEFDKQAKEAKTIEDLQRILQALFAKYGDTVNQSFMIFTHGKQEHLYIGMNKKMYRAMMKVVEYCKHTGEDINAFMEPITAEYMKEATKKLAAKNKKTDTLLDSDEVSNG